MFPQEAESIRHHPRLLFKSSSHGPGRDIPFLELLGKKKCLTTLPGQEKVRSNHALKALLGVPGQEKFRSNHALQALLGGDEGLKIDNTTAIFFFKTFEGYPQSIPGLSAALLCLEDDVQMNHTSVQSIFLSHIRLRCLFLQVHFEAGK
jgi:hypothetical protein